MKILNHKIDIIENDPNFTLLVFIGVVIVIIILAIFVVISHWNEKKKITNSFKEKKLLIRTISEKNLEKYNINIKKLFENLFDDFDKQIESVASLNGKYSNKLNEILESDYLEDLLITSHIHDAEINFLRQLKKVTPFVWTKKYKKEIQEYYGQ